MSTKSDAKAELHERLGKIEDFVKIARKAFADAVTSEKNIRAKNNFKNEHVALISKLIDNAAESTEIIDDRVETILETLSAVVRQLQTGVGVNNGPLEKLNHMNILTIVPLEFESDGKNNSPFQPTPKKPVSKALKNMEGTNEKDDEEDSNKKVIPEPFEDTNTNEGDKDENNENDQSDKSSSSSSSSSNTGNRSRSRKSPSDVDDDPENEVSFMDEVNNKSSEDFYMQLKHVQEENSNSNTLYVTPDEDFKIKYTSREFMKILKQCAANKDMTNALKFLSKNNCKVGSNYRDSYVKDKLLSNVVTGLTDVSVIALRPLENLVGKKFTVEVYSSLNHNWSKTLTKIITALRAIIFKVVVGKVELPSEVSNIHELVKWMKDQSKVDVADAQSGINLNCNVPDEELWNKNGKPKNFTALVDVLKKYEKEFKDKLAVSTGKVENANGSEEAKIALKFYRANCQNWLLDILAFQTNHEGILKDYNIDSLLNVEAFSVLKKPPLTMLQLEQLAKTYNQTNKTSIQTYTNHLKKFLDEKKKPNQIKGNKKEINNTSVNNGETKGQNDQKITVSQFNRTVSARKIFENHIDEKTQIKLIEVLTSDKNYESENEAKKVMMDVVEKTFKSALKFARFNNQAKGNGQIQNRRKVNPSSRKIPAYCFDFLKGSCTKENCRYRHITKADRKAEFKAVDEGRK